MYKMIALCGSARKAHTYGAARQFLDGFEARGDVVGEIIVLSEDFRDYIWYRDRVSVVTISGGFNPEVMI